MLSFRMINDALTADDFAALAPTFDEQEEVMSSSFDTPENFHPTEAQLAVVTEFAPGWMVGGVFQGDDNDMACIVSRVARQFATNGNVDKAVDLEVNVAPKGFANATPEEFRTFFEDIAINSDFPGRDDQA